MQVLDLQHETLRCAIAAAVGVNAGYSHTAAVSIVLHGVMAGPHDLRAFELVGNYPIGIVDIPLLYETGAEKDFDKVIVTACPPEMQVARLIARGLDEAAARQRLAAQWPTEKKTARADLVVNTDGTFEETDRQVDTVLRALIK